MTSTGPAIERARQLAGSGKVREGARLLRDLLVRDRNDTEVRRALAQIYRDAGHLDQAARYEFGMPYAVAAEQELFLRHVVSIGADEARLRRLAILPDDLPIPDEITTQLETLRRIHQRTSTWDGIATIGGIAFALASLLTVLTVYVIVLVGGEFAQAVARVGGVASLAALVILTVGVGVSCWIDGSRKVALGWTLAAAVLVAAFLLATVALIGSWG